jgi:hypothetical protein
MVHLSCCVVVSLCTAAAAAAVLTTPWTSGIMLQRVFVGLLRRLGARSWAMVAGCKWQSTLIR